MARTRPGPAGVIVSRAAAARGVGGCKVSLSVRPIGPLAPARPRPMASCPPPGLGPTLYISTKLLAISELQRVQAADTFMCLIMYIYFIIAWYFIKVSSAKKLSHTAGPE